LRRPPPRRGGGDRERRRPGGVRRGPRRARRPRAAPLVAPAAAALSHWVRPVSAGRLALRPRRPHGVDELRKDWTLSTFTPDLSAALDGPDRLRARRAGAAEAFAAADLPGTDEEIWRYSRFDEPRRVECAPAPAVDAPLRAPARAVLDAVAAPAATVVAVNGRVASVEVADELAAKGVHIGPVGDDRADLVGAAVGEPPDAFVTLHDAFVPQPVVVDVPEGVVLSGPVVVVHVTAGDGAAAFPHLVVHAGPASEVAVVEVQSSGE